jgi:hypothetical protein
MPITFVSGRWPLIAAAIPAASPPPESGTRTAATSGKSSTISSPIVPCPAHDEPVFRHQPVDLFLRLVLRLADNTDLGTQPAHFGELVLRYQPRHADRRFRTGGFRRISQRPAVIAGRGGNNAALPLVPRKRKHGVGRAPKLESAGPLVAFELQVDVCAAGFGQRR